MNYIIEETEMKTAKSGVPYIRATVKDNQGKKYYNATIFSNFPNFANLKAGDVVEGEIKTEIKVYNGQNQTSHILNPKPTGNAPRGSFGGYKGNSAAISKAQETKKENIAEAMDKKELAIKVASTMRMAVDLAIAETEHEDTYRPLDELIVKWRHYCWQQWDKTSPDDIAPF